MSLTGIAFVLLFGAALVLSFIRSPMFGLYAYLAAFYVHPPSRWWGVGLPDLRWSLLASIVLLLSIHVHRKPGYKSDFFSQLPVKLLIVFTLWAWIQLPWALSLDDQLVLAIIFTKYVVLLFAMYEVLRTEKDLRDFLMANVIGCGYLGYLAWQAGGGGRLEGVGGPGINEANALGMQLAVGMMFASMMLLLQRDKWWLLVLLLVPFMANGVVQSVSRSAFLALVVGGIALWYYRPKGYSKLFYTYAGLAVFAFLLVAGAHFWSRMSSIQTAVDGGEVDQSAQSRVVLALAQWEMFKVFPHGAGHRGTAVLSPIYIDPIYLTGREGEAARASHNTFLTLMVEQGVPGVIMFLVAVGWTVSVLKRLKALDTPGWPPWLGATRAAAAAGLAVILVGGLFVDYLKMEVQIWCLAMLLSLVRIAEHEYDFGTTRRRTEGDATAAGRIGDSNDPTAAGVSARKRRRGRRLIGEATVARSGETASLPPGVRR